MEDTLISDLSDVICYVDFSNIFDRNAAQNRHAVRQKKAESMFRPEGIVLDFGAGPCRYLAFERSNSMSRKAQISFVREDIYEPLRRRIMLDMKIGSCQLSKLYAYHGLMLSGGTRLDGIEIDKPHRVIVIDNEESSVWNVPVITVIDKFMPLFPAFWRQGPSQEKTRTFDQFKTLLKKHFRWESQAFERYA